MSGLDLGTSSDVICENVPIDAAKVKEATNRRKKIHSKSIKNDPRMVKLMQETMRKEIMEKEKEKESFIAESMKKLTSNLAKETNKKVSRIMLLFLSTVVFLQVFPFSLCYRK